MAFLPYLYERIEVIEFHGHQNINIAIRTRNTHSCWLFNGADRSMTSSARWMEDGDLFCEICFEL